METPPVTLENTGCSPLGLAMSFAGRIFPSILPSSRHVQNSTPKPLWVGSDLYLLMKDSLVSLMEKHIPVEKRSRFIEAVKIGDDPYSEKHHPIFNTMAFSYKLSWAKYRTQEDRRNIIQMPKYYEEGDTLTYLMILNFMVNGRNLPWNEEMGSGNFGFQLAEFYLQNQDLFPDLSKDDVLSIYSFNDRAFSERVALMLSEVRQETV